MPKHARDADKPTASTPATFEFNYDAGENCPEPHPMPGVRTLVGPMDCRFPQFCKAHPEWVVKALAHPSKTLADERHSVAPEYRVVAAALRQCGLKVCFDFDGVPPEGGMSAEEEERLLFFECDSPHHEATLMVLDATGQPIVEVKGMYEDDTVRTPWVRIKLHAGASQDLETRLVSTLHSAGIGVACLPHAENEVLKVSSADMGFSFKVVHGEGADQKPRDECFEHADLQAHGFGSLFTLSHNSKVVGKVLCAYQNGEVSTAGPTLEIIEIAQEWRGHGIGRDLLYFVEHYLKELWQEHWEAFNEDGEIRLSACNVNSREASSWFKKRGFRDDDGMGEELSKQLLGPYHESGAEPDASESDEEVVRCRGITTAGTRCSLTDERGPEGWYYKARPLCEGSHYCGHHSSQGR